MKIKIAFFILIFALFYTGCSSSKALPYSFAENEGGNGSAKITFITNGAKEGVDLYYFENIELPIPEKKTYWAPVIFPAGRPLKLTVNIYGQRLEIGTEKIFECPPLTAGKEYLLVYETKPGPFGKLVLKDAKTKKLIIYEQKL